MRPLATTPKPVVPYTALVGRVLQRHRESRRQNQDVMAGALNLTQSAYSRIERGDTTVTVAQLRVIARQLGLEPGTILDEADGVAANLRRQGVDVTDEKGISPAAVAIGLGILAAIMMAKK